SAGNSILISTGPSGGEIHASPTGSASRSRSGYQARRSRLPHTRAWNLGGMTCSPFTPPPPAPADNRPPSGSQPPTRSTWRRFGSRLQPWLGASRHFPIAHEWPPPVRPHRAPEPGGHRGRRAANGPPPPPTYTPPAAVG